jgi:hypothetical protein
MAELISIESSVRYVTSLSNSILLPGIGNLCAAPYIIRFRHYLLGFCVCLCTLFRPLSTAALIGPALWVPSAASLLLPPSAVTLCLVLNLTYLPSILSIPPPTTFTAAVGQNSRLSPSFSRTISWKNALSSLRTSVFSLSLAPAWKDVGKFR